MVISYDIFVSLAATELLFSTPEHVEMNQFIFGQLCRQV
jgi:hypothetical protein